MLVWQWWLKDVRVVSRSPSVFPYLELLRHLLMRRNNEILPCFCNDTRALVVGGMVDEETYVVVLCGLRIFVE